MVGLFAYALGGALQGAGEGLVEEAKAKREAALESLRNQSILQREEADRSFRSAEAEKQRGFEAEQKQIEREFELSKVANSPKTRPLTDQEKADLGLPVGNAYQMDKEGKITQIGGSATTINVGGERGYDKTVGEGYGKIFLDLQEEARTAQRALNALDVMEQATQDPGFYSGAGAEMVTRLKRVGAALGLDPEGIDSIEAFNAQAKQAALDTMGGSLGTGFSNADRDFVLDQVPNLQNTPQGNRKLIEIQRKLNIRKQEIAQKAREYAEEHDGRIDAGFDAFLAEWANANPLFPPDWTYFGNNIRIRRLD